MAVWTWLRMKKERHHPFRLRDMEEEEEEFTHHYCSMVEAIMIFTDTL